MRRLAEIVSSTFAVVLGLLILWIFFAVLILPVIETLATRVRADSAHAVASAGVAPIGATEIAATSLLLILALVGIAATRSDRLRILLRCLLFIAIVVCVQWLYGFMLQDAADSFKGNWLIGKTHHAGTSFVILFLSLIVPLVEILCFCAVAISFHDAWRFGRASAATMNFALFMTTKGFAFVGLRYFGIAAPVAPYGGPGIIVIIHLVFVLFMCYRASIDPRRLLSAIGKFFGDAYLRQ